MSPSKGWFTLRWSDAGVEVLDQRALPERESYLLLEDAEAVARAIESLAVRGAPAIGCAAALGIAREAVRSRATSVAELERLLDPAFERLAATRPTAVNLFWALGRMRERLRAETARAGASAEGVATALHSEAQALLDEDLASCRAIGAVGAELIPDGARVLTHCNAGALATAGYGTALGVVRAAVEAGRKVRVLADETRPFLQGARLTAWELQRDGIEVAVHTDNMAGHLMQSGEVDLVIVGADRVAANGDVANKIGTYPLAVLAREHDIPFYVAIPLATLDLQTAEGAAIPIEERAHDEVTSLGAMQLAPRGVAARHPAFDVTPARLVTAFVTERGIARPPFPKSLPALARGR